MMNKTIETTKAPRDIKSIEVTPFETAIKQAAPSPDALKAILKKTAPVETGFKAFFHENIFDPEKAQQLVERKAGIRECLILAAKDVWHSSDYDPITLSYRDYSIKKMDLALGALQNKNLVGERCNLPTQALNHYVRNRSNITTIIASALGLPTEIPPSFEASSSRLTWLQVAKNFIGYDKYKDSPLVLRCIMGSVLAVKNLIKIPFGIGASLVQVFTEFLPQAVLRLTNLGIAHAYMAWPEKTDESATANAKRFGLGVALAFLSLPFITSKLAIIAGRAFSSPNDSRRAGWQVGEEIGGTAGKIIGATLSTLSVILSITEWTLVIMAIIGTGGAALAAMPQVGPQILAGLKFASATVLNWPPVANLVSTLGQAMLPVINPIVSTMGAQASALAVGISTTVAAVVAPVKYFFTHPKRVINSIREFFTSEKQEAPAKAQKAPVQPQPKVTNTPTASTQSNSPKTEEQKNSAQQLVEETTPVQSTSFGQTLKTLQAPKSNASTPTNSDDDDSDDEYLTRVIAEAKQAQQTVIESKSTLGPAVTQAMKTISEHFGKSKNAQSQTSSATQNPGFNFELDYPKKPSHFMQAVQSIKSFLPNFFITNTQVEETTASKIQPTPSE